MIRLYAAVARWVGLVLVVVWLGGCASSSFEPTLPNPKFRKGSGVGDFADMRDLPQDACAFVPEGKGAPILSKDTAFGLAERFARRHFAPWHRSSPGYPKRDVTWASRHYRGKPGYDASGMKRDPSFITSLVAEANLTRYPSILRKAVTTAHTSLRALPTKDVHYGNPQSPGQGYPFDNFQMTAVWANTPLFITHVSRSGTWALAESPYALGWVPMADIAFVDDAQAASYETGSYAVAVKDKVRYGEAPGLPPSVTYLGQVFPVVSTTAEACEVLYAVGSGSTARITRTRLSLADVAVMPLPATTKNLAEVANRMMGQAYGWGGVDEKRDCSSMVRDLFAPFGIWLPRNSAAQAKSGTFIPLDGLTAAEKEAAIVRNAIPFATLVWMRGHIMVYIGAVGGKPVVFHNVWGLRTLDGGVEGRKVIGKAVITTLRAGEELSNVGPDRIFLNRVKGITLLNGMSGDVVEPGSPDSETGGQSGDNN